MPPAKWGGRKAQEWVAKVLDTYGDVCHLCRHPGSDTGDHLRPVTDYPDLMFVVSNGRPAHHRRCPTCGEACNIARRAKPLTRAPSVDVVAFFERR